MSETITTGLAVITAGELSQIALADLLADPSNYQESERTVRNSPGYFSGCREVFLRHKIYTNLGLAFFYEPLGNSRPEIAIFLSPKVGSYQFHHHTRFSRDQFNVLVQRFNLPTMKQLPTARLSLKVYRKTFSK